MRYVKITENLTIFQENLLDWVDSQIIFNNNKDKYFKTYEFLFTNINNFNEWEKLLITTIIIILKVFLINQIGPSTISNSEALLI